MTLGDRIVIMKDGIAQQIGTPHQVFDNPANIFVAGFIGVPQMNFFDADLVRTGDSYVVRLGGFEVAPSEEKQANLRAHGIKSQKITLGVRPEHITLAPGETACLEGTVDVSEMMGSSVHLHMTSLGQDVIAVVNTMDATDPTFADRHNVGERVEYAFTGNAIHLFDKETGTNLEF